MAVHPGTLGELRVEPTSRLAKTREKCGMLGVHSLVFTISSAPGSMRPPKCACATRRTQIVRVDGTHTYLFCLRTMSTVCICVFVLSDNIFVLCLLFARARIIHISRHESLTDECTVTVVSKIALFCVGFFLGRDRVCHVCHVDLWPGGFMKN